MWGADPSDIAEYDDSYEWPHQEGLAPVRSASGHAFRHELGVGPFELVEEQVADRRGPLAQQYVRRRAAVQHRGRGAKPCAKASGVATQLSRQRANILEQREKAAFRAARIWTTALRSPTGHCAAADPQHPRPLEL